MSVTEAYFSQFCRLEIHDQSLVRVFVLSMPSHGRRQKGKLGQTAFLHTGSYPFNFGGAFTVQSLRLDLRLGSPLSVNTGSSRCRKGHIQTTAKSGWESYFFSSFFDYWKSCWGKSLHCLELNWFLPWRTLSWVCGKLWIGVLVHQLLLSGILFLNLVFYQHSIPPEKARLRQQARIASSC